MKNTHHDGSSLTSMLRLPSLFPVNGPPTFFGSILTVMLQGSTRFWLLNSNTSHNVCNTPAPHQHSQMSWDYNLRTGKQSIWWWRNGACSKMNYYNPMWLLGPKAPSIPFLWRTFISLLPFHVGGAVHHQWPPTQHVLMVPQTVQYIGYACIAGVTNDVTGNAPHIPSNIRLHVSPPSS